MVLVTPQMVYMTPCLKELTGTLSGCGLYSIVYEESRRRNKSCQKYYSGYFPACNALVVLKIEARPWPGCTRTKGFSSVQETNKNKKKHF